MYEDARRFCRLYSAEDKIAFFVGPGPHGTPPVSREAVYRWLIKWLNNGKGDPHDVPVKIYNNHELLVTKTGRVEDEPGSRKTYQLFLDDLRAKRKPGTTAELLAKLQQLGIRTDGSAPLVKELDGAGRIRFESEPGIEIDASVYVPTLSGKKPAVLLLASKFSDVLADRAAKEGRIALVLEPRHSPSFDDRRPFLGDWLANTRADQIGVSLPGRRAYDILRGVDLLCARKDVDPGSIRAAAQGVKGIWLLLAAAADPRIQAIWLDKTPYSLEEALHNTLNANLSDAVIPGFVLHWDLEDLIKAMRERLVMRTDPANWMGKVVWAGPRFQYRWVLGDLTEQSDVQDVAFTQQFLK